MKPLSPQEVQEQKQAGIPDEVYQVFNTLIIEDWDGHGAVVRQDTAVNKIVEVMKVSRHDIFKRGWLNVERAYIKEGWKVEYDKPGYNESYEATFTFTKMKPSADGSVSAHWVLNQLAGMSFPEVGGAYDWIKNCLKSQGLILP